MRTCFWNGVGQRQESDVVDDRVLVPLGVHDGLGGLDGQPTRLETAPVLRPENNRERFRSIFSITKKLSQGYFYFKYPSRQWAAVSTKVLEMRAPPQ